MYRRTFFTILVVAYFLNSSVISSDSRPRVAVIPFNAIGISEADALGITLLFETTLQNTGAFDLIEQTRAEAILEAQEYSLSDCTDEFCAVEIGKLLAAEQIIIGTVGKIGKIYYLNVKLIEVETGRNLSAQKQNTATLEDLIYELERLASTLVSASVVQEVTEDVRVQEQAENAKEEEFIAEKLPSEIDYDQKIGPLVDNGDGTITDTRTGLMWSKNPAPETGNFEYMRKYCANLRVGGYDDWRYPWKRELHGLYESLGFLAESPDRQTQHFEWNSQPKYWCVTLGRHVIDFSNGRSEDISYQESIVNEYSIRAVRDSEK
ncbi:hypothetical protein ES705_36637 [subsurface metagenome]